MEWHSFRWRWSTDEETQGFLCCLRACGTFGCRIATLYRNSSRVNNNEGEMGAILAAVWGQTEITVTLVYNSTYCFQLDLRH